MALAKEINIRPEDEDIVICRCEDISRADILRAMQDGYTTVKEIKLHLRAGMGMCQGRTCTRLVQRIVSEFSGEPLSNISGITVRPPAVPIPLGLIAGKKGAHANEGGDNPGVGH